MRTYEWQTTWVDTLVESGISRDTALDTFKAIYRDRANLEKNPVLEAQAILEN